MLNWRSLLSLYGWHNEISFQYINKSTVYKKGKIQKLTSQCFIQQLEFMKINRSLIFHIPQ